MGKLPGYDSQAGMTTQVGTAKRDLNAEAQGGRDIANLGKAVQQVNQVWQEAKDFKETLQSQGILDSGQREIFKRAQEDPDYENSALYHDDLAKVREASLGAFSSNRAKMRFMPTANNQTAAADIKIDGVFRSKLIDHTKADIIQSNKDNHADYIAGDLAAKEKQALVVSTAFEKGFVTETFVVNEGIKLAQWDYDRAIADAQKDPFKTLANIDQYDIISGKKDDLVREIKQIAEMTVKVQEVAVLQTQAANQSQFQKDLDAGMNISESLDRLDDGLERNTMDKDWVKSKRAAILSAKGIDAEMQVDYFYDVVKKINRANAQYTAYKSSKNAKIYIKENNESLIMINEGRASGKLDKASEKLLLARTFTKDIAAAEQDAGKNLILATEHFEATLNQEEVPYAIVEYLKETGKDSKKANAKQAAIVDKIQRDVRAKTNNDAQALVAEVTQRREKQAAEVLPEEAILKRFNVTEEEIENTMKTSGKTREDVIKHLRKVLKGE